MFLDTQHKQHKQDKNNVLRHTTNKQHKQDKNNVLRHNNKQHKQDKNKNNDSLTHNKQTTQTR